VPLIAARAGVTPSTIYRRWGDLPDLLADVAMQQLRPDSEPAETGTLKGDLQNWAEQYLEEMSSDIGLSMMRDVLYGSDTQGACKCAAFTASQIQIILDRALVRGEATPEVDTVMDGLIAPIIYRTLFGPAPATHVHVQSLIDACLKGASKKRRKIAEAA
jgi:AcrR family transcriptional regulator